MSRLAEFAVMQPARYPADYRIPWVAFMIVCCLNCWPDRSMVLPFDWFVSTLARMFPVWPHRTAWPALEPPILADGWGTAVRELPIRGCGMPGCTIRDPARAGAFRAPIPWAFAAPKQDAAMTKAAVRRHSRCMAHLVSHSVPAEP